MAGEFKFHTKTSVEVFPDKVRRFFDSPDGPVGIRIKAIAQDVLENAIPRIGTRYSGQHDGPRLAQTGSVVSVGGAAYAVVFNHPKAQLHHDGAPPHGISATGAKFLYRNGPGVVTSSGSSIFGPARKVSHPGFKGNPFVVDAAIAKGLKPSGQLRRGTRPVPLFRAGQSF